MLSGNGFLPRKFLGRLCRRAVHGRLIHRFGDRGLGNGLLIGARCASTGRDKALKDGIFFNVDVGLRICAGRVKQNGWVGGRRNLNRLRALGCNIVDDEAHHGTDHCCADCGKPS